MDLQIIDENAYNLSDCPILFQEDIYSKSYGLIKNKDGLFAKLAWRSDVLSPQITIIDESYFAIGIDNDFAIVNSNSLFSVVKLKMAFQYCETVKTEDNKLLITSELEIYILSSDFVVESIFHLPDVYETVTIRDQRLIVDSMNSEVFTFEV